MLEVDRSGHAMDADGVAGRDGSGCTVSVRMYLAAISPIR